MTYAQIYAEVEALAFDASWLTQIKNWIRAREGEVWQYAEWPVKDMATVNLTVTGGTATVPLPAGFGFPTQAVQIFDAQGVLIPFVHPDDFYTTYQEGNVLSQSSQYPSGWTITETGGTPSIRFGPIPGASGTYTIRGWELPIHRTAATAYAAGTMSADTDLPWWPDDYHYFLVSGAVALGGKLTNGLDWQSPEQDFQDGLHRLRQELMEPTRTGVEMWGDIWA